MVVESGEVSENGGLGEKNEEGDNGEVSHVDDIG